MTHPPILTTYIDGQEAPLGPLAALWARTYEEMPRKAADAIRRARTKAQEARQSGDRQLAEDYEEAGDALEAILRKKTRCRECGRGLDDPVSVARGVGPDCWAKLS